MGRGKRQPKRDHPQITVRDASPREIRAKSSQECWEFSLTTRTKAIIESGDQISGSIYGNRIVITRRGEALGVVPKTVAREIIAAIRETSAKLQGQVISAGHIGIAPTIELCLS